MGLLFCFGVAPAPIALKAQISSKRSLYVPNFVANGSHWLKYSLINRKFGFELLLCVAAAIVFVH